MGELLMSVQGDEREEAQQRWGGAPDRQLGPLPLGLDAQVPAGFFEGDFELPPRDEPSEDLRGRDGCVLP